MHSIRFSLSRSRRSGFALLAALGFLAALFIVVIAANASLVSSLHQGKRAARNRQALEISRAAATLYARTGTAPATLDGYSINGVAVANSDAVSTTQPTQPQPDDFVLEISSGASGMRTVWRPYDSPQGKSVILLDRQEI